VETTLFIMEKLKFKIVTEIMEFQNGVAKEEITILCDPPFKLFNYIALFDKKSIFDGLNGLKSIIDGQINEYEWWGTELVYLESNSGFTKITLDDELGGTFCIIDNSQLIELIESLITYSLHRSVPR
jgi:hypothetical protein